MKTQFQYKNYDFIKTSVGLGQAVGRWRWGGEEQREGERSKGSFIHRQNWAARQNIRKRPLSREASGPGRSWEGRMCYRQGEC